jgi:hypothetical protein
MYMQLPDGQVIQTENTELWKEGKRLTLKEGKRLHRAQHAEHLRDMLKPGQTVHCVLKHASRSGMRRHIQLLTTYDGNIADITHAAAVVMDDRVADDGGIIINGCGMDMGFALVYSLGRCLFPDGFKVEGRGRNGDTSGHDNDGGYALRSHWL